MKRMTRTALAVAAAVVVALGSFGIAAAASGGADSAGSDDQPGEATDSDTPLSGSDLDAAVAAALEHTGGGKVTETEVGDDGAAYGVEIRLEDGSQVEVNLDENFTVIGSEDDDD